MKNDQEKTLEEIQQLTIEYTIKLIELLMPEKSSANADEIISMATTSATAIIVNITGFLSKLTDISNEEAINRIIEKTKFHLSKK